MLEVTNLRNGAILNHARGTETDDYLEIKVEGIADPQAFVKVNGADAERADRCFSAQVRLTQKINEIVVSADSSFGERQLRLTVLWDKKSFKRYNYYIDELLTLASIIEKETGVPEERGLVASVFVNRLRKGMKLQTDPTVIYALTEGKKDLGRSLRRRDLRIDSPYNTYKYYGLPPTPICNPGREAIMAAAHPEKSDFLYFVANGRGGHNFSKTLNEHNRHVRNWVNELRRQ